MTSWTACIRRGGCAAGPALVESHRSGEQTPLATRGIQMRGTHKPLLNWEVTPEELRSYEQSVARFLAEFADDILESKVVPHGTWAFRNAAHHSGTANQFVEHTRDTTPAFYAVKDIPHAYVMDGSILRAAGIANSGLTLIALGFKLAEHLRALA